MKLPKWVHQVLAQQRNGKRHKKQKFFKGDVVMVDNGKDRSGMSRSHFTNGLGVVEGSYHDEYGGGNIEDYTINFKGGQESWYPVDTLTLVRKADA